MKLILILAITLLLNGCTGKVYEDPNQQYLKIISRDIPVYNDIYLNDILEIEDNIESLEILSDNYQIDTTKLGKHQYEVFYQVKNKKYVYKYSVNIVDIEAPIVFSGTNKTVNLNYEGDLCNLITYGDNYTRDVKCIIKGIYDLSEVGTYKLIYELSDSSNNVKEVNVTLNVIKPVENKNTANNKEIVPLPKTEFSEVYEKFKNDQNEIGIDVSKWQGEIDFEKVKNAGASFVMMRIGVQSQVKGELTIDPYYEQNIKSAKNAGLKVGVYLYSIATSSEEAIKQAKWVLKTLNGENLDLPVVFDWENWSKWNNYKISFYDINTIANNFMTTIKNNGYESMIYSSKFYLETIWTNKMKFPVWLAHYTDKTNYGGSYQIWQLCNDGHIDGIESDVDIDIMYN